MRKSLFAYEGRCDALKKIVLFFLSIILILSLSSCARIGVTLEIDKDGTVDMTQEFSINESFARNNNMESDLEDMKQLPPEYNQQLLNTGIKAKYFSENGYSGYTLKKSNIDIEDIESASATGDDSIINPNVIKLKKKGWKYILDIDSDIIKESLNTSGYYLDDKFTINSIGESGGYLRYVIKLPYRAKKNNATSVSLNGRELTWDLLEMDEGENIHVEFSLINDTLIIVLILLGIIVIVGVVIFVIMKKRKAKYDKEINIRVVPQPDIGFADDLAEENNSFQGMNNEDN